MQRLHQSSNHALRCLNAFWCVTSLKLLASAYTKQQTATWDGIYFVFLSPFLLKISHYQLVKLTLPCAGADPHRVHQCEARRNCVEHVQNWSKLHNFKARVRDKRGERPRVGAGARTDVVQIVWQFNAQKEKVKSIDQKKGGGHCERCIPLEEKMRGKWWLIMRNWRLWRSRRKKKEGVASGRGCNYWKRTCGQEVGGRSA